MFAELPVCLDESVSVSKSLFGGMTSRAYFSKSRLCEETLEERPICPHFEKSLL